MKIKRILNNIRLAFFPISYGLTGALVGGTLNRILIADLDFSATVVGIFFAIPLLVSPVRVWLGYRSDGYPIMGRRREPYIIFGALLTAIGAIMAVLLSVNGDPKSTTLVFSVGLAFVIFGFGRNLGHNTFQALISDRFDDIQRSRAITLYEVATLIGLIAGAGGLGKALETFDAATLISVTLTIGVIVLILAIFSAIGNEPRNKVTESATDQAREMPFPEALRTVVLADPQVRLFFVFVLFTFIGTLAQDVLLEPYGALALDMSVGDTTRLTMFWGVGVMVSMILSGIFLIKWLGYMRILRIGIIASILVFLGVILSGVTGNPNMFNSLVLVMGLGTGLAGAGMLTGVINFTTKIRAGLLMGVWGFANLLGRALGSIMGGAVVDIMLNVTNENALISYGTVFGLEIVMLLISLYLTTKIDLNASVAQGEASSKLDVAYAGPD